MSSGQLIPPGSRRHRIWWRCSDRLERGGMRVFRPLCWATAHEWWPDSPTTTECVVCGKVKR